MSQLCCYSVCADTCISVLNDVALVPAHLPHTQDNHTRAWLTFILTSRWLGARLDLIVFLLVVVTAFSAVAQLDKLDAGSTGLSLSYIMQLTGVFQWAVRQSAEMQNQLTSVERPVKLLQLCPS